jgi:hypothetical protein
LAVERNELVIAGTVNAAAITYSTALSHNTSFLVEGSWTGSTISGLAKLQVSADNATWRDYPDSEVSIDGSGSEGWEVTKTLYPYVRIHMESISGDITFAARFIEKRDTAIG